VIEAAQLDEIGLLRPRVRDRVALADDGGETRDQVGPGKWGCPRHHGTAIGWLFPVHGSNTIMPVFTKSLLLRETTIRSLTRAVAAIRRSGALRGLPLAASRRPRKSQLARMSTVNGNTRSANDPVTSTS